MALELLSDEWENENITVGDEMYDLCSELFPICRSITGDGLRESLAIVKTHIPDLKVFEVPSGTICFDWEVPLEWNIRDAYIIDPDGNKICDFKRSNLHVGGYEIIRKAIECIGLDETLRTSILCDPQLGKRGLYPNGRPKTLSPGFAI